MPRELCEEVAPAMAPTASVVATFSFKSLLLFLKKHELEVKVIVGWLVWSILRLLQSLLGPMRRHSRHWFVQYGAMAAYYLPTLVVFYTAKAVYSSYSYIKVILSVGCCILLISCARGAVTMTAYTLDHDPRRLQSWQLLPWLLYFAWLQWGPIWWDRKLEVLDVYYFIVLSVAPMLYVLLVKPRSRAAILDYETKEFADRMMQEFRTSPSPFFSGDANSSSLYDRCRYPVKLPNGQWINFSDVLQKRGRMTGDFCAVDPDSCLSYSFCRLLARRYFGFPCAEDGSAQVRDFVLTELLLADNEDNNNRAFAIVEVQLALLHDYFFTNYHSRITSGLLSVKQAIVRVGWLSLLSLVSTVAGGLLNGGLSTLLNSITLCVTAVLVPLMYGVIVQPVFPVLPTYWHPIRNLFLYYPTDSDDTGHPVTDQSASSHSQSSGMPYWRDKMGQYSVMEDYDRRSYKKAVIAWCKVHVLSQVSYSFIKHHPAEREDVKVPDSVKRSVARAIQGLNNAPPTMGTRSLRVYADRTRHDLSWTCRQETLTHTILIWHIATCYCDMMSGTLNEEDETPQRRSQDQDMSQQPLEEPSTGHRRVARTLSRYCAYLVAFLPELLPEHSLTAKVVLQQVLQEPRDLLGKTRMSMEAKRSKIQQLEVPQDECSSPTTFQKGVRLGWQLEHQPDVPLRWKAMADFWSEMILYVASSPDKATAHIQQLAQGGELVTHLWALLCNAGIVMKREAEEPATSS